MLKHIDVHQALIQERELERHPGAQGFVYAMFDALNEEVYQEHIIQAVLQQPAAKAQKTYPKSVPPEMVFGEAEIKRVCVRYRLRFLEASQFTAPLPYEALRRIKTYQKRSGQAFESFRIVAPADAFHLPDCTEDPLLFADLGMGRYALIYKWGNDLHPFRSLRFFPQRSFKTMALTVFMAALLITAFLPLAYARLYAGEQASYAQAAFAAWAFVGVGASVACFMLRKFKGYSSDLWKRPFS